MTSTSVLRANMVGLNTIGKTATLPKQRRPSHVVLMEMQNTIRRSASDSGIKELIRLKLMKYTRPRKLICRHGGTLLEIRPNGELNCTSDANSPYAMLQVISISANMIAMWGSEAQLYLAVKENGEVYSTHVEGRDCVFIERFTQDFYNTYESYHSFDDTSIHYYLTLKTPGKSVQLCENTSDKSEFYWELPIMTSSMAINNFKLTKKDENNNFLMKEKNAKLEKITEKEV